MTTPPQRVALLFAMPIELAPMARVLRKTPTSGPDLPARLKSLTGRIGDVEVLAAASGVGFRLAAEATEAILHAWHPDVIVMAGVAGQIDRSIPIGDVVVVDRVATDSGELTPTMVPWVADVGAHRGGILSNDVVSVAEDDRGRGLLAVEMETAAVAAVAIEHGVPWAGVRAISDRTDVPLPLDMNKLREADGDMKSSRVALAALIRPWTWPGLVRLAAGTNKATAALTRYLTAWLTSTTSSN